MRALATPFATIALLLAACACAPSQTTQRSPTVVAPEAPAAPSNGRYYALVIGIDKYAPASRLPPLSTAQNDARQIGKTLHDLYGFEVHELLGPDATHNSILTAISKYRSTISPDDNLVIYYAGHGYLDKEAEKAYWLPYDAEDPDSPNHIIADELTADIRAIPARHVLIISDSCYSGDLTRAAVVIPQTNNQRNILQRMLTKRSRTLMASGGDEPVSDTGKDNHSIFAYTLLQSLQHDKRTIFTASDIFYSEDGVRHGLGNVTQVPYYKPILNSGHDDGDFVFVRAGSSLTNALSSASSAGVSESDLKRTADLNAAGRYAEARVKQLKNCDAGDNQSCVEAAQGYLNARGVAKDPAKAATLLAKACDRGDHDGCNDFGTLYEAGGSLPEDEAKAAASYQKACDLGDDTGCSNLGVLYEHGMGVTQDFAKAALLYKLGCDRGEPDGCTHLGNLYQVGTGVAKDPAHALTLFDQACTSGYGSGCFNMAVAYVFGTGVPPDLAKALELFTRACDDSAQTCASIGDTYENGQGVAKDLTQALSFYRKGCDNADKEACTGVGNAYLFGYGVEKSPGRAAIFYGKACENGEGTACYGLGALYETGSGVVTDTVQAMAFFHKGCDLGVKNSCDAAIRFAPHP